jgi:hypothetical protein
MTSSAPNDVVERRSSLKSSTSYRAGPLYLITRHGYFHIRGTYDGKLIRVATRTADLRRAKVVLDDLLHELETGWRKGSAETDIDWKAVAKAMTARHRFNSRARGIPFQIESSDIYLLLKETGYRCAVSGIEFSKRATAKGAPDPWCASIDRIDNRHGYVKGNVRIVCLAANLAMNRWGYNTLLRLSLAVTNNARTPTPEKVTHHGHSLCQNGTQHIDNITVFQ